MLRRRALRMSERDETCWYRDDLGTRVIRPGSQGDDVGHLQAILAVRYPEFALGLMATGIYDNCTEECVRVYQAHAGLKDDGVVGKKTARSLGI